MPDDDKPKRHYVLWIDDDRLLLKHSIENLNDRMIDCTVCDDFDKALEIIEEKLNDIDLVLIDVMMRPSECLKGLPTKHGFEAGLRFVDLLDSEVRYDRLDLLIYTNSRTDDPYYPKPVPGVTGESRGSDRESVEVVKKGKYKARKFAEFVHGRIHRNGQ